MTKDVFTPDQMKRLWDDVEVGRRCLMEIGEGAEAKREKILLIAMKQRLKELEAGKISKIELMPVTGGPAPEGDLVKIETEPLSDTAFKCSFCKQKKSRGVPPVLFRITDGEGKNKILCWDCWAGGKE